MSNNNLQIDEIDDEKPNVYSVAGIVLNILTAINNDSIDAINENDAIMNDKYLEDTPVEQTLCAIWDLSSLEEYAIILMDECQIHRIVLKVIKYFFYILFNSIFSSKLKLYEILILMRR